MSGITKKIFFLNFLLMLIGAPQILSAADAVGEFVFVRGIVTVISTTGEERPVASGSKIYSGDTVNTKEGRSQILFADETFVSIQPQSTYKVEDYRFDRNDSSVASAVFRLVKGGLRAVTGLVAEQNAESYKVKTPIATIGIRGTSHNTRLCQGDCPGQEDGLYHRTWQGVTYVANERGSLDVPAGKAVYVKDPEAPIQPMDQPSIVNAVQRSEEDSLSQTEDTSTVYQSGEQLTTSGTPQSLTTTAGGTLSVLTQRRTTGIGFVPVGGLTHIGLIQETLVLRDGVPVNSLFTPSPGIRTLFVTDPIAIDALPDGLESEARSLLQNATSEQIQAVQSDPARLIDTGTDPSGNLLWGRWDNGKALFLDSNGLAEIQDYTNNGGLHVITGPDLKSIPSTGSASYTFVGGTRSTTADGSSIGQGVTSGTVSVNFGNSTGFLDMDLVHFSQTMNVSGGLNIAGAGAITGNSVTTTGGVCSGGCSTSIEGGLSGPKDSTGVPETLGLSYGILTPDHKIGGVAGFAKQ